eukprot:UN31461
MPLPEGESVVVPKSYIHAEKKGDRGTIRRSFQVQDKELYTAKGTQVQTLYDLYQRGMHLHADNPWLGVRTLGPNDEAGGYEWMTYKECGEVIEQIRDSIATLGVKPKEHIAIYGKNKPEWVMTDYGCQCRSNVPVPLYDTLGPDAAAYVIDHAECVAVFCDWDRLDNSLQGSNNGRVQFIVSFPLQAFEKTEKNMTDYTAALKKAKSQGKESGITVYGWEEFLESGKASENFPPTSDDLATICYTSGTTGTPKGAMITHNNLLSDAGGLLAATTMYTTDRLTSYLPLAHMYERAMQVNTLHIGASSGFYRGDTLLLLEDFVACEPTVFIGVPRLYNKLYDKVMAQIEEGSSVKRWLFNKAYNSKIYYLKENGSLTSSFDFLFKKIRAALGGKVRLFCTGSAPISDTVMNFLKVAFSAPVVEGYGQTESTCAATASLVSDQKTPEISHVGVPLIVNEICLISVKEMDYTINDTDKKTGQKIERGEICFRGPNVFKGYWKMPEKTAETIDEDGWLHSGDIGTWTIDGNLKIIDRKKNIFKLSQGEYVAPEKIENIYIQSKWCAQAFVYGNSLETALVAIVVPDEEVLIPY